VLLSMTCSLISAWLHNCVSIATACACLTLSVPLSPAPTNAVPPAERQIAEKIQGGLKSQSIKVADTSGGCGAMYR
jgi:hypothetical protein